MDNCQQQVPADKKISKVVILEEKSYDRKEIPPPNSFSWFEIVEMWDKLPPKKFAFFADD